MGDPKSIVVLGASGLIGHFLAADLTRRGFAVTAVARRFSPGQRHGLANACELPIVEAGAADLAALLRESKAGVVVNCLGVLQDMPGGRTRDVHEAFVARLLDAMRECGRPVQLVHISIPGSEADDRTGFSRTKRNAERSIAASGVPYAILRPGFVWAPAAYGGSALLRSLAASPFGLSPAESNRPFAPVAVEDVAETVAWLVERGAQQQTWELMHPEPQTVGGVVSSLRRWLGAAPPWFGTPKFLLDFGAMVGDLAAWVGWRPPVRSTALAEMRRGVEGDPGPWMKATGIAPRAFDDLLRERPATVQDRWFAQLYALKAVVIASLVVFWCASGLIALTVAYDAAVAILTTHGFPDRAAHVTTVASSLMDISVGLAIAFRRTCRLGLIAGVIVAFGYMGGSTVIAPDLWIEPLGALLKTFPAIVLMLVALATLEDR